MQNDLFCYFNSYFSTRFQLSDFFVGLLIWDILEGYGVMSKTLLVFGFPLFECLVGLVNQLGVVIFSFSRRSVSIFPGRMGSKAMAMCIVMMKPTDSNWGERGVTVSGALPSQLILAEKQ